MGRNPVTIRYLISTICIVMLLWGCDSATEPPAKPKVVRKKIVSQKKQTAKVRKEKDRARAKTETADKTVKKIAPAKVKPMPVAEVESDKQPLDRQKVETQPSTKKKPAIKPKSDISKIDQPVPIQPPAGRAENLRANDKLIASAPKAAMDLTGIPAKYDPTGKTDPFEPLFQDKPVLTKKRNAKRGFPRHPWNASI